jgi:hypothetical protein
MKKISYIFTALILTLVSVSCKKDKGPDIATGIVAEWHLVGMTGYEASQLPSVYVEFKADKSFDMYQKVGDVQRYSRYTGTYAVTGNSMTGEYSDGIKWGGDKRNGITYKVSFDGAVLCLAADNGSGEVCRYEKASLPQGEKDAADMKTKSSSMSEERFL